MLLSESSSWPVAAVLAGTLLAVAAGGLILLWATTDQPSSSSQQPKPKPNMSQMDIGCRTMFEPTLDWQEVQPYHVCPAGLEYRMDFSTGQNFARIQRKKSEQQKDGDFLANAIANGLVVCPAERDRDPRADSLGSVLKKLGEIQAEVNSLETQLAEAAEKKELRRLMGTLDRLQRDEVDSIATGALPPAAQERVRERRRGLNKAIEGLREKHLPRAS